MSPLYCVNSRLLDRFLRIFIVHFAYPINNLKVIVKKLPYQLATANWRENPKWHFMVMSPMYKFREDVMNAFVHGQKSIGQSDASYRVRIWPIMRFYGNKYSVSISWKSDERFRSNRPESTSQSGGHYLIRYAGIEPKNLWIPSEVTWNKIWGFMNSFRSQPIRSRVDPKSQWRIRESLKRHFEKHFQPIIPGNGPGFPPQSSFICIML